ncbi:MAG: hypothetical protein AMS16_06210 [Planctomycetes bacterium DG_58]|nr:MAG: hypothetical protein AMS16_06210 [Planctomycetes bacterium DG_58]KPK98674.1 MAG: hypothetical protein AMK75_06875 [Planctomycetes bacterium SM23_65]
MKQPAPAELADVPAPQFTGETLTLEIADGVNMKFVLIPAGKFVMGSPIDEKGRCDDEGPQRLVTITKPYYMGVYEVTWEQYEAVMGKGARKPADPQLPALTSHHFRAARFCRRLSAKTGRTIRLPTEAEWEHACRAGTTTRFSFGDDDGKLDEYGWFVHNSNRSVHPVGQKKPNPWGLYDMHGNAWEWCGDWYADSLLNAAKTDPKGPESGEYHVVRGGSWSYLASGCRSASRLMGSHNDIMDSKIVGFRVVCADAEKP